MNKQQTLAMLRRMMAVLESSTNKAIIRNIIRELENDEATIALAIHEARVELKGSDADKDDPKIEEALDILREAVAESRNSDEPMNKHERDFVNDYNNVKDEITILKERKEKIKQLALNHRSKLSSEDLDEYNDEIQTQLDKIDKEIREKRKEIDYLLNERDNKKGDRPKMEGLKQQRTKSLGEFFIENVGEKLKSRGGRFSVSTPEYNTRAATDIHWTGDNSNTFLPALTQVDRTVVQDYRRPTILNLFRWGSMTGQAISYFYEVGKEGVVTAVAEKGKKPQLHYTYGMKTDALSKVAGFVKVSNEMIDDLDFIVTEINNRLIYDVEIAVENQVLNGSGTAPNILGLLNREGIQTETSESAADNPDALFRAATKIQTATGLMADGIVINPLDYQTLRLKKDNNGQYLGGGFFQGQYGNGGLQWEPPLWGFRTVVSPAVSVGTALVGAFVQGATPYTKGGIIVESTNSHEDDFIHNLVTIRAEQRIALAVRRPDAFVKVTLSNLVL